MRVTFYASILMSCLWLLAMFPAFAQTSDPDAVQAHIDAAVVQYQRQDYTTATAELQEALRLQKKSALAYYWLGMIALKESRMKEAEKAFQRAISLNKKLSEPHNGLGLVYRSMKHRKMDAIDEFKRALALNPRYTEAQYNLATTYLDINSMNVFPLSLLKPGYVVLGRQALQQTLELDPNHPDANFALGLIYEVELKNIEKAIPLYVRQLQVNPHRTDTLKQLALCYFKTRQYQDGVNTLTALIRQHDELRKVGQPLLMMLQASIYLNNRQYERAMTTYEQYLQSLPEQERRVYDDITTVASEREREEYASLTESGQVEYRKQFWKQKDPDPTTPVNERLIEHYRRVTFARAHFGGQQFPWDRRGEIYVRYGDPDDRQIFTFAVGEKQHTDQAQDLDRSTFAPTGNPRVDAIREMNRQLRYQLSVETSTIGVSALHVESWVYVAMGIELFFVDQLGKGVFDYPLPTDSGNVAQAARQAQYHPEKIARELIKKVPEHYRYDYGGEPMSFFFDTAAFRGGGNKSTVDVAVAVPMGQLGALPDGKGAQTSLEGRVTMIDAEGEDAASAVARFGPFLRPIVVRPKSAGAELTTFQLPVPILPGEYTLAVAVRDAATRKVGIYRQPVSISSYTSNQFLLSDIKLASSITPTVKTGPFVRSGLEVVPNPTRTYALNHPVYVYYELYNLRQDAQGKTSFKTDVTVTARQGTQSPVWRVLSGFGRFADQTKSLTFTILDASTSSTEARYTAIDLSSSLPGRYTVEIAVTDLNANRTMTKTVDFVTVTNVVNPVAQASRWRVSGQDSTASEPVTAPEDSLAAASIVTPKDSVSSGTVTTLSVPADSSLTSESAHDSTRHSWSDLLRILQSPQYTVASGDSTRPAVRDTAISEFLTTLTENLNQSSSPGGSVEYDEYKDMVYVTAGEFLMGSDSTYTDERPPHAVNLEAFYVDRYEVTNEQYKRFLDATGHAPPRHWVEGEFPPGEARYPVVGVSWYDAMAYAQWAGKRLPTEAEWEKAARGTDGRLYPWGDEFAPDRLNVGGQGDPYETAAPVGSFPEGASPYGALDMAGNVWEWTADWYQPYPGNTTPNAAYGEQYRVIRGGSWMNYDTNTRVSNRGKYYPSDTSLLLGFRCARGSRATGQEPLATAGRPSSGYGYLFIVTPDTWADIYVDGEKLGQTPQADPVRLRPGSHTLVLMNPDFRDYQRTVVVEANVLVKERAVLVAHAAVDSAIQSEMSTFVQHAGAWAKKQNALVDSVVTHRLAEAVALYDEGDYEESVRRLRMMIPLDPALSRTLIAEIHKALAFNYVAMRQQTRARQAFQAALQANPHLVLGNDAVIAPKLRRTFTLIRLETLKESQNSVRRNTLWRSFLVSGWGQLYRGQRLKGYGLMAAQMGLLTGTAIALHAWVQARDAYMRFGVDEAVAVYAQRQSVEDVQAVLRARHTRYTSSTTRANVLMGLAAGLWGVNLIDAIVLSARRERADLSYQPGERPARLAIWWDPATHQWSVQARMSW